VIYLWHHVATLNLAPVAACAPARARWPHRSPHVAVLLWPVTLAAGAQATATRIHRLRHAGPPPHIASRTARC
jgi:hypothetical protein